MSTTVRFALDVPKIHVTACRFKDPKNIQESFELFHATNPQVYDALVRLAWQLKMNGYSSTSLLMLYHILRQVNSRGLHKSSDGFGLPNSFASRYARLILTKEPGLCGFFKQAELRAETKNKQYDVIEDIAPSKPATPQVVWH